MLVLVLAALQPQSVLRRGTFAGTFPLVVFHYLALSLFFFFQMRECPLTHLVFVLCSLVV